MSCLVSCLTQGAAEAFGKTGWPEIPRSTEPGGNAACSRLHNPAGNKTPPWEVSLLTSHPFLHSREIFCWLQDEAAFWAKGEKGL